MIDQSIGRTTFAWGARHVAGALAAFLALAMVVGNTAAVAATAPAWSRMPSPNATTPQGKLAGVSCGSSTWCAAVGDSSPRYGNTVASAEIWDGRRWTLQRTPKPTGQAYNPTLSGVSCSSVNTCAAVGSFVRSSGQQALAEEWNGSGWVIEATPKPTGAQGYELSAVSCISAVVCMGVGSSADRFGKTRTLAEVWNGTSWSVLSTRNQAGATDSVLSGVSCSTTTTCTAVGYSVDISSREVPLAEGWDGTTWTVQPTPKPNWTQVGSLAGLWGVSCVSPTACTAVGYYTNRSFSQVPLAVSWDGAKWTRQTIPSPRNAGYTQLKAVSCTSPVACTSVGDSKDNSGTQGSLAESWNGSTWTIEVMANPTGAIDVVPTGVSCTSSTDCRAVGYSSTSAGPTLTLAEAWNGLSWVVEATPNRLEMESTSLSQVSCTLPAACTAIGSLSAFGQPSTAVETFDGNTWTIKTVPQPNWALSSALTSLSCPSPIACTAVGHYTDNTGTVAAWAEIWNGTTWTVQTTPSPPGAISSLLSGVSCTSPAACVAVGQSTDNSFTLAGFAEIWNGTTWTVQTTPSPPGATATSLTAVSCASSLACTAVGFSGDNRGIDTALAMAWNGTTWTVNTTPSPPGAFSSGLTSVSCVAVASCTAVGQYNDSSGYRNLAEAWNGTTWTVHTAPSPQWATGSGMSAVSCASATACIGVGYATDSRGAALTFAEAWNGATWTVEMTPNPPGAANSYLTGVSCLSATDCMAVGSFQPDSNNEFTFVARYS